MRRIWFMVAAAFLTVGGATTIATAQTRPSNKKLDIQEGFAKLIKEDVAKGFYTRAQGDELERQAEVSAARLREGQDRAGNRLKKTIEIAGSGNLRDVVQQLAVFVDKNREMKMGGTDSQVQEQSTAIYNAADAVLQTTVSIFEDVRPLFTELFDQTDHLYTARTELILSNPAVSASDKAKERLNASKFHDFVKNSLERTIQAYVYSIETVRDQFQSDRNGIIAKLSVVIKDNSEKYGNNPAKWPKPAKAGSGLATAPNGRTGGQNRPGATIASSSSSGSSTSGGRTSTNGTSTGSGTASSDAMSSSNQSTGRQATNAGQSNGTGYGAGLPSGQSDRTDGHDDIEIVSVYHRETGMVTETYDDYYSGQHYVRTYRETAPVGYNNIVDDGSAGNTNGGGSGFAAGDIDFGSGAYTIPNVSFPPAVEGPYASGDVNGASFVTVYRGYVVRPGDNGSTIILVPSTQVERPSSVLTAPSNQVEVPSTQILVPSTQVEVPSLVNGSNFQPTLCGR